MRAIGDRRGRLSPLWTVGWVVIVLLATLTPQPEWRNSQPSFLASLRLPRSGGAWFDVLQNVSLYIPLGMTAAAAGSSRRLVTAAAATLSLLTELLQFIIPGRDPSARDVAANTLGTLAGWHLWMSPAGILAAAAGRRCERWFVEVRAPGRARAARLLLGWTAVVSTVAALTAVLLRPAPPPELWIGSPLMDASAGPLRIGSNGTADGYFAGAIDEVRIYGRPRDADEIRADMRQPLAGSAPGDGSLLAAYAFDARGATAKDESGHGRDGVLRGASWIPDGWAGGAVMFDGRASEVVVPPGEWLDLRDGVTLEAWVRPSEQQAPGASIISRAGSVYYLDQASSQGALRAAAGGRFGKVPDYAILPEAIPHDRWTHLTSTYDGQRVRLYVNGSLAATQIHWSPHRSRASLNGRALTDGPVGDSVNVSAALAGAVDLEVSVVCGATAPTRAPLFVVAGLQDVQVLALTASRDDLIVNPWTWARRLKLAAPGSETRHLFAGCPPGQRLALSVRGPLQNPSISRNGRKLATLVPGLGSTWAFVFHADLFPAWLRVSVTCLWLAAVAFPAGFWGRAAYPTAAAALLGGATFVLLPYVTGVRPLDDVEIASMLAGLAAGYLVRRGMKASG